MGRLVEDHGALLPHQREQVLPAAFLVGGEEALKGEACRGKPADGQGADGGGRSRDDLYRDGGFGAEAHQILPGVGDAGHAGVGHHGTAFPRQNPGNNLFPPFPEVVFVVAHQGLFDGKVVQKLQGDAGILRGDKVHRLQNFHRAGGKVLQIADGRTYNIENGHNSSFMAGRMN